jgi:serine/threonine-protein kinase
MTIRTPGLPVTRGPRVTPAHALPTLERAVIAAAERAHANQAAAPPTVQGVPAWSRELVVRDPSRPANVTVAASGPARPKPAVVTIRAGNAWEPPASTPAPTPAPAVDANAQAPVLIGGYEVAARIARGGMGSLYVCRRAGSTDGRLFTMKVVRQHTIQHDLAAASFRHEATIGSLFRHPNALTVVDTGVHEGQPYLIFDYVEGGSLSEMLLEETRPTPAIVTSIVLDVLAALHATHQANDASGNPLGLVHCDVSPENVLVGVDGVARLVDFGSARFTAIKNESQPFAVSKPPYMPPEQFRGDKLDSRSDIYSTGVMLWTALTGQQPFAAESYDATVMNVMRKKISPPSAHRAPRCFDEVCMQALSRSPEGRFVVAGAMAAALRTAAESEKLVETREAVGQWVRRSMGEELSRRHRLIEAMFSRRRVSVAVPPLEVAAPAAPADVPQERSRKSTVGVRVLAASRKTGRHARQKQALTERQQTIIALSCALAFATTVAVGVAITRRSPPDDLRVARTPTAALTGAIGGHARPESVK